MKNIANTIAETLLVASFVALLAIPVLVFGGFSPTTRTPSVKTLSLAKKDVLGVQTTVDDEVISYKTELLPTTLESIVIEEAKKENDSYEMTIRAYKDSTQDRNEDLLRIVNTSDRSETIVIHVTDYFKDEQLENLKLKIDDTAFTLSDIVKKSGFEPAITLQPNEWLTIGVFISKDLQEPSYFSIRADIFAK